MRKWRVLCNVWLVRLGIREVYPAEHIRAVRVEECGERLVDMDEVLGYRVETEAEGMLKARLRVCLLLLDVVRDLPAGYVLKVKSAYRSVEEQRRKWKRALERVASLCPGLSEDELKRRARAFCADPTSGDGGGHQTGGALDVTLYAGTEALDMGTEIGEYNALTKTENPSLTPLQRTNREILRRAMERAGFVNYPNEWWHYSYGDQMWCAYARRRKAFYGKIGQS